MKVIIKENKIIEVMDRILKISYNPKTREFYSDGVIDGVIGYKEKDGFTYAGYYVDNMVCSMFGDKTDEWLLLYINNKFPNLTINRINN